MSSISPDFMNYKLAPGARDLEAEVKAVQESKIEMLITTAMMAALCPLIAALTAVLGTALFLLECKRETELKSHFIELKPLEQSPESNSQVELRNYPYDVPDIDIFMQHLSLF